MEELADFLQIYLNDNGITRDESLLEEINNGLRAFEAQTGKKIIIKEKDENA